MSDERTEQLHYIRRIAIDILQAGNYLEHGEPGKAVKNLDASLKSIKQLILAWPQFKNRVYTK